MVLIQTIGTHLSLMFKYILTKSIEVELDAWRSYHTALQILNMSPV